MAVAWDTQDGFDVLFDWGAAGVSRLTGGVDVMVIVDVLRFTTAVLAAAECDVAVLPYRWRDEGAAEYASQTAALLADGTDPSGPSLCPASLRRLPAGTSVVLPSPNGSTCSLEAAESGGTVAAGCLRNAAAVAITTTTRATTTEIRRALNQRLAGSAHDEIALRRAQARSR